LVRGHPVGVLREHVHAVTAFPRVVHARVVRGCAWVVAGGGGGVFLVGAGCCCRPPVSGGLVVASGGLLRVV
jgi:hypothetical protein